MASSIPPQNPWFLGLTPNSTSFSSSAAAFITVSSSGLRLGHLIHLRYSPLSSDGCQSDNFINVCDIWCRRRLKRGFLLDSFVDVFSTSCSSYLSFFSGKDPGKGYDDKQKMQIRSPNGNYFNGRQWTNILLALNILVYVAQVASHGKLTLWGAKVNSLIDKGQLWRLATSSFLHANIGHLMMNCYSLNSIGPTVEHLCGPRRFLAVYFTSALSSSLLSYKFCQSPALGASGAIFGLVGSFAVFVLRHKNLLGGGKQDLQEIARVIALNMAIGLLSRGIDNWGHLGGLLGGAAISWFLGPAWKYKFLLDRGSVLVDGAPIFHLIKRKRLR